MRNGIFVSALMQCSIKAEKLHSMLYLEVRVAATMMIGIIPARFELRR